MAITTFAELQTALATWSHRSDLTALLPDFITLAEARLNDMLLLKNMESDEALTLTSNQNYVALPTGFVSPIAFWLVVSSQRIPLEFVLPQDLPYNTSATQPKWVAVDGANLRFDCPASSAYSAFLRCIKQSNLSVSSTTNYLLTKRPDIYLAASMVELSRYTQDVETFNMWEAKFQSAVKDLKASDSRSRSIVNLRTDLPVTQRHNIIRGD